MRGLWLENGRAHVRDDLPRPEPAPEETRVQVLRAGVCATDLALARGYMGFRGVPGHEFVGIAADGPLAGRRVVGEINAGCGTCEDCRRGDPRHCASRTVLGILGRGGAFAEELVLPSRNLHPVPDGLATDHATFVEPAAAAFELDEQLALERFEAPLVVGDGRLGLLCAQVLALRGLRVLVHGRHPERLLALHAGGQTHASDHAGELVWCDDPGERAHDLVVEATGQPEVLQRALGWVRPRGTLALKTTSEAPAQLDLAPVVIDELTLIGSRCGPFAPALAALAAGRLSVEPLIHARYPLARADEALRHAGQSGVLKVLIEV